MSATRDSSQKIAFVYSNLYQIYKDGLAEARGPVGAPPAPNGNVPPAPPLSSGLVIKTGVGAPQVRAYTPAELIGKRVARPEVLRRDSQAKGLEDLKQSLKSLNELHARLKFMLQELDELTRE